MIHTHRASRTKRTKSVFMFFLMFLLVFTSFPMNPFDSQNNRVHAQKEEEGGGGGGEGGEEEGGVKQHEMFEFEAFINHDNVVDGTAPFDSNDEAGNDSDPHNRIVRSWDTVTYPLKITINPKKADVLKNIKLRITGTLQNGITNNRINAQFAVGGYSDVDTGKVGFTQEYTVERTGNSIMIPVAIDVLGAKPGVKLKPEIKVQVVSVDGKDITRDNVVTVFDDLPEVKVSAKVSIKPYVGAGLTDWDYPYLPYSKMNIGDVPNADETGVFAFAVSWGVDKLPGKSDMKGATFPDPNGVINYRIELYGDVYWSSGPKQGRTEPLDFNQDDTRVLLFDHRPVTTSQNSVGSANTMMDGRSYRFDPSLCFWAPRSSMLHLSQSERQSESLHSVLDSGDWAVKQPTYERQKTIYRGTNTGFTIGDTFPSRQANYGTDREQQFGVNDKLFSSHAFLVDMQNEYRIGGPNNPDNNSNNVYYRARVVLENYTDENGNVIDLNRTGSFTHTMRNEAGTMSAFGTFKAYPYQGYRNVNGYLSPKQTTRWANSVGDASIIAGGDVYFEARVIPGHGTPLYGGYEAVYRWNTDAFELTEQYAREADNNILARGYRNLVFDWVTYDRNHQKNYYGVPKFSDNSFKNFMSKGKDDYEWYATYQEAVKHGAIGAIKSDVRAPVGGIKSEPSYIPLRVKHENIGFGSETHNGTPLVATIDFYAYMNTKRTQMIDVNGNRPAENPSRWDANGNLLELQRPVDGSVQFESLAVVPAKTSTSITSDKDTYYNSETISWTVDNSVVLPKYGVPEGLDSGVVVKQTLPKGLDYKPGSGEVGDKPTEPEVVYHSDGTKTLIWKLLISNRTRSIDPIKFKTTINPFALGTGVQSSVEVKSVIESELDGRPVEARTSSKSVTVIKVGMVGIYESIDKTHGGKNSDFTLTMNPYTTIEDEMNVTGLTTIPIDNDRLGSHYSGTAKITDITLTANREHNDPVKIYLNRNPVTNNRPHEIDVHRDGWYEYTGQQSQLKGAVSLLFVVEGKMTNRDNIQIKVKIQTENNNFGDEYLNETVINSDTDYRLSPVSNRVRYSIRADLELKLERFQIYTDKHTRGLPTRVRVNQVVLDEPSVRDEPITLAIYESSSGKKVAEKTMTQHQLRAENEILIPPSTLSQGSVKNYEVRIEGFNKNKIWVRDGEGSINTDGYTAKQKTLTLSDANGDGNLIFKDVVMTERELGREMNKFYETLTVKKIYEPKVKSGYGFELKADVEYKNDLLNDVRSMIPDVNFTSDVTAAVHHNLMDKTVEYYDPNKEFVNIALEKEDVSNDNNMKSHYKLPRMYIEKNTGHTFTANQKEKGDARITNELIDAGNKLYVPVWINKLGNYNVTFANNTPIGSHFTNFKVRITVNVFAHMFHHTDSDTTDDDELLIHPIKQEDIPNELGSGS